MRLLSRLCAPLVRQFRSHASKPTPSFNAWFDERVTIVNRHAAPIRVRDLYLDYAKWMAIYEEEGVGIRAFTASLRDRGLRFAGFDAQRNRLYAGARLRPANSAMVIELGRVRSRRMLRVGSATFLLVEAGRS